MYQSYISTDECKASYWPVARTILVVGFDATAGHETRLDEHVVFQQPLLVPTTVVDEETLQQQVQWRPAAAESAVSIEWRSTVADSTVPWSFRLKNLQSSSRIGVIATTQLSSNATSHASVTEFDTATVTRSIVVDSAHPDANDALCFRATDVPCKSLAGALESMAQVILADGSSILDSTESRSPVHVFLLNEQYSMPVGGMLVAHPRVVLVGRASAGNNSNVPTTICCNAPACWAYDAAAVGNGQTTGKYMPAAFINLRFMPCQGPSLAATTIRAIDVLGADNTISGGAEQQILVRARPCGEHHSDRSPLLDQPT